MRLVWPYRAPSIGPSGVLGMRACYARQNGPMTVAAVILAAGASTRFGSAKAVARIGSRTMLEVVVDTATAAGLAPIIVVAPSALTVPESATAVRNDAPELGMSHSLRLGIAAVPPD